MPVAKQSSTATHQHLNAKSSRSETESIWGIGGARWRMASQSANATTADAAITITPDLR
jgi:hypothetical protein